MAKSAKDLSWVTVIIFATHALEYWREYRTFRHMANDHQIKKSVINRAVIWVENALSGSEEFKLNQGVNDYLPNAIISFKASKNNPFTDEQKALNTIISKYRIPI